MGAKVVAQLWSPISAVIRGTVLATGAMVVFQQVVVLQVLKG